MALNVGLKKAIFEVDNGQLASAFKKAIFVYGTTGGSSKISEAVRQLGKGLKQRTMNFYDPGPRTPIALSNQMMDLYYGQKGTTLHEKRIPIIAEYVHHAMGFKGAFDMNKSGREAYLETYPDGNEGWAAPKTGKYYFQYTDDDGQLCEATGTKYMSYAIREAIAHFGGTLIFEGRNVVYSQVFLKNPPRVSDTDLEAQSLFRFFTPGKSKAKFGSGTLIFHWEGKESIPTKEKFETNWVWVNNSFHKPANFRTVVQNGKKVAVAALNHENPAEELRPIWNNFADQ